MQDLSKLPGLLDRRRMSARIDEYQFGVLDVVAELLGDEGWCDRIVTSPDDQGRHVDLDQIIQHVMISGGHGNPQQESAVTSVLLFQFPAVS